MNTLLSTEKLYELFIETNQKITTDTRKFEQNSIFFALKGANFNGNDFAANAISSGCKYAIVDEKSVSNNTTILLVEDVLSTLQSLAKFHRSKLNCPIIGITGSNGKTTNKELINAVLSKKYKTYATQGNLNNHIGVPLTLLAITKDCEIGIIEMGANHQGEIDFLSKIAGPNYGLITNIGKAHLEGFGGIEGVKKGKGELYNYIKNKKGKIFINGNDRELLSISGDLEKIYYGDDPKFDIYGKKFSSNEFVEFKWNCGNQDLEHQALVKTHIFGDYNFINLLCAVCIGNYFKVSKNDINVALEAYIPEMNRSQIKKTESNTIILDAYNANPSSMALAIENFNNQEFSNKIMIIGDMLELGEFTKEEHEKIIKQAKSLNNIKAFFIGEHFYEFKLTYPEFIFFKSKTELKNNLQHNKITESNILIKASRSMQLENIVDTL
jgi:UDP-N-acetylmuramoyl-tripeptide--D-alanyl-D-alanine ligase